VALVTLKLIRLALQYKLPYKKQQLTVMRKKKWLRNTLIILVLLAIVYLLGPHPAKPVYDMAMPTVPADTTGLTQYIQQQEGQHKIKRHNEARIVWYNDSLKNRLFHCVPAWVFGQPGRRRTNTH
jgi:hypothetical protein